MSSASSLSEIGALVGDPGRVNILTALLDGRALTATELAFTAGVAPATASEHLAKLVAGGLLAVARQGRSRYFRLASSEVARMLEGMMVVSGAAEAASPVRRATPRISPALREARPREDSGAVPPASVFCFNIVHLGRQTCPCRQEVEN